MQYRKISGPLILSQQSSGRKQTFHSDNLSLDYFLIRKLQPTLCSFFVLHASTLVVNETMFTSFPPACTLSSRGWPSSTTAPCMQWYHVYVHLLLAESESVSHSSCTTLYSPMDCIQVGSSFHGISQARILDWIAISFSRGSSQPRDQPRSSALQADSFIWGTRKLLAESSLMETQNPSLGSWQL